MPSSRDLSSVISSMLKLCFDLPSISCISKSKGGGSSTTMTIYGPREVPDDFPGFDLDVAKIDKMYRESKVKAGIAKEYLESSYCSCLGLLDSATNIRINASIAELAGGGSGGGGGGDKDTLAKRSLNGLVAFLACLFPCLPNAEALAYLDAVDADPMAAAALIVTRRRGVKSFSFWNAAAAMEMALRCAAVATKHPDPSLLVKGWTNVSPCLMELDRRLSGPRPHYGDVKRILGVPFAQVDISGAWTLANARLGRRRRRRRCSLGSVFTDQQLPPVRAFMKRVLLARIHGFYLQALGSFPKDELVKKYHRALVMGGYCYGPLHPAANIIVNTVRYEQTFPTPASLKLESAMIMFSTKFLTRLAARSLYGLVSFLCARYPSLTPDHAMQRLMVADCSLQAADPDLLSDPSFAVYTRPPRNQNMLKLDWSGCPRIRSSGEDTEVKFQERAVRKAAISIPEAYAAAATAAFHPSPPAEGEFLGSPASVKKLLAAEHAFRLDKGYQLSKGIFDFLYKHLLRCAPSSVVGMSHLQQEPEPEPTGVSKAEYDKHLRCKNKFRELHDEVKTMVVAALDKFNRDNKSQYSLHVICGVNELVSGPELCSPEDIGSNPRGINPSFPCKFLHCHINFLATCFDEELHDQPTNFYFVRQRMKLFFAECSRAGDDSWCAPVDCSPDAGQARCFYCEKQGSKIIHPARPCFHGSDFQEAFFGSCSDLYCNDSLFGMAYSLDWVHGVEEDAIYEKNCKHQVGDYGDAGNGLKLTKLEPLGGDVGNGLKPVSVLGFRGPSDELVTIAAIDHV